MFTLLKKEYRRSGNLFRHYGQTPSSRTIRICSSKHISQKQLTAMASKQANICLDSSLHAFKAVRPSPLIVTVPKKPSIGEAAGSDQMDSDKTPQKEKATLLHFGILRKRSSLWRERQFTSTPDRRAPSLPSSCTRYERSVGSQRTILNPWDCM